MKTVNEIIAQFDVARARINEIYTLITGQQSAEATLVSLNSVSTTSRFNLWKYVTAIIIYLQQELWSEAKIELAEIRDSGIASNKAWFAKEWKKFQYGDSLLVNDTTGKYYYAVIDTTKQIVKKLAIIQANNNWVLKVAKEDASGNSVPLTAAEFAAYKSFIDRTQPPGPSVPVISLPGDVIDVRFNIYYNPIKPVTDLRPLLEAAYLAYIKQIDIEGESIYYISKHIDALQAVEAVKDVQLVSCQAKPDGGAYASVSRIYVPVSGYMVKDNALTLTVAINLIPSL